MPRCLVHQKRFWSVSLCKSSFYYWPSKWKLRQPSFFFQLLLVVSPQEGSREKCHGTEPPEPPFPPLEGDSGPKSIWAVRSWPFGPGCIHRVPGGSVQNGAPETTLGAPHSFTYFESKTLRESLFEKKKKVLIYRDFHAVEKETQMRTHLLMSVQPWAGLEI